MFNYREKVLELVAEQWRVIKGLKRKVALLREYGIKTSQKTKQDSDGVDFFLGGEGGA